MLPTGPTPSCGASSTVLPPITCESRTPQTSTEQRTKNDHSWRRTSHPRAAGLRPGHPQDHRDHPDPRRPRPQRRPDRWHAPPGLLSRPLQPLQPPSGVIAPGQAEPMTREVRFDLDRVSHTATAAGAGVLSVSDLAELGALLQNSLAEGCTSLVLDLAHCTDFPPHAAGLLNRLADEAHAVAGRLAVHGVPSFHAMLLDRKSVGEGKDGVSTVRTR